MPQGKYEFWLSEGGQALLAGWARDGLTDKHIAKNMGISAGTLCQWKKKFGEIQRTLETSRELADYEVENALRDNALGGNTTAQIFWLKNRRPDKWQDKPAEHKLSAETEDDPLTRTIREAVENGVL